MQWTTRMLKPSLAHFWHFSAWTGTSVSSVVSRKGLVLLEVEAQILRWHEQAAWDLGLGRRVRESLMARLFPAFEGSWPKNSGQGQSPAVQRTSASEPG